MEYLTTIITLIYCCCLALAESDSNSATHFSSNQTSFIVGGEPASTHEFPYQISFQYHGSHICGGSIIGPRLVVTAAHCIMSSHLASYRVVAGINNLVNSESTRQIAHVQSIEQPGYNEHTKVHDIAVVKLAQPLEFNSAVSAVKLPTSGYEVPDGLQVVASGWGRTIEGGSISSKLLKVSLPTVSHTTCVNDYSSFAIITNDMLCAGGAAGKGGCQGDSGGPLVFHIPWIQTRTLVGVTSFGVGCGEAGYPGIFTKVSHYIDWIKSVS